MPNMETVKEKQCLESSRQECARYYGIEKCKQTAVKTSDMAAAWIFRLQKVMPFTYFSTVLLVTCRNDRSICSLSSTKKAKENIH